MLLTFYLQNKYRNVSKNWLITLLKIIVSYINCKSFKFYWINRIEEINKVKVNINDNHQSQEPLWDVIVSSDIEIKLKGLTICNGRVKGKAFVAHNLQEAQNIMVKQLSETIKNKLLCHWFAGRWYSYHIQHWHWMESLFLCSIRSCHSNRWSHLA